MELINKSQRSIFSSQRKLAKLAGLSYKSLQLIEGGADTKVSSLEKIASAMGYAHETLSRHIRSYFDLAPQSVYITSLELMASKDSWEIPFFDFVDAFRRKKNSDLINVPPHVGLAPKLAALLSATIETLCLELNLKIPAWCDVVQSLDEPWFVSGIENLKASALVESPVTFRRRNIFVLGNFLDRA